AVERGLMRAEPHGNKPGYVVERAHPEVRMLLGEFSRLNGHEPQHIAEETADDEADVAIPEAPLPLPAPGMGPAASEGLATPRKRTGRGSRGRSRRRSRRGRKKTTSSGPS